MGKNKLSSRIIRWLFLAQEHNANLNHIDGASNLFSDALLRIPRLDDIDAYDCDNKITCAKFYFAMYNENPASKKPFALCLANISGM